MPLPPFAVVDLETSGFSMRRHRILQIGLVTVDAEGKVYIGDGEVDVHLREPGSEGADDIGQYKSAGNRAAAHHQGSADLVLEPTDDRFDFIPQGD